MPLLLEKNRRNWRKDGNSPVFIIPEDWMDLTFGTCAVRVNPENNRSVQLEKHIEQGVYLTISGGDWPEPTTIEVEKQQVGMLAEVLLTCEPPKSKK